MYLDFPFVKSIDREADSRSVSWPAQARVGLARFFVSALLLVSGALAMQSSEAEIRVGPVNSDNGYPMWYEDETGLRFEICTDQDACFFSPPDTVLAPSFPTNWPDEAFYWAAEAAMAEEGGTKALMGMAREAAFFGHDVVDGDQIVFSRLRFYIDGAPSMLGQTYTITHPYGTETFVPDSLDAGPGARGAGYSATHDVGISKPLEFSAATSVYPVFLIPASMDREALKNSAGALLDTTRGLGTLPVQGSPYGTNFFRIEGPGIGDVYPSYRCADPALGGVKDSTGQDVLNDCVETDQFSIMGRTASRHGVEVEQATYDKVPSATDPNVVETYVNVWARSIAGQTIAARVDAGPQVYLTEGANGTYYGRLQSGRDFFLPNALSRPGSVQLMNITDVPNSNRSGDISDVVAISSAEWDMASSQLQVTARSSDLFNTPQLGVSLLPASTNLVAGANTLPGGAGTQVFVFNGPAGMVAVPPSSVRVTSMSGSSDDAPVAIIGGIQGGGQVETLQANAGPDKAVEAGAVLNLNGADSTGSINYWQWSTTSADINWSCVDAACSMIELMTPGKDQMDMLGQNQIVATFTLMITDSMGMTSSDSATITVTNPGTLANDNCDVLRAQYRDGKQFWRIEGTSDVLDQQRVFAYLGGPGLTAQTINPAPYGLNGANAEPIGEGRVNATGLWEVRTPRRSAEDQGTVPEPGQTHVYIQSERGCFISTEFTQR
jgi:hypothetical protein